MSMNTTRLAKKASQLRLSAISIAENMQNGSFRSLYRGQGIEFSDVREYLHGDNVRSIDWNVTARMGRAFIKQYEEDKELSVFLILDCSRSMESGLDSSRLSQAQEAAALLLLAAEHISGAIGAVFFDGKIQFSCEPKAGRENSMMILSKLDKLDSTPEDEKTGGSVLPNAITGAAKLLKKRSLVFILSDFRSAKWEKPFARLAQKNDVYDVVYIDNMGNAHRETFTATGGQNPYQNARKKYGELLGQSVQVAELRRRPNPYLSGQDRMGAVILSYERKER